MGKNWYRLVDQVWCEGRQMPLHMGRGPRVQVMQVQILYFWLSEWFFSLPGGCATATPGKHYRLWTLGCRHPKASAGVNENFLAAPRWLYNLVKNCGSWHCPWCRKIGETVDKGGQGHPTSCLAKKGWRIRHTRITSDYYGSTRKWVRHSKVDKFHWSGL